MTNATSKWKESLSSLPLVAILRGIEPADAIAVGGVLIDAGFNIIEVPLNSPQPFDSIEKLAYEFGDRAMIGAGTVLTADSVTNSISAGARLIVAPNFNESVARAATGSDAIYCPGVATPTEAFNAIDSGADALKLFPAEMIAPVVVKAMRAVLPESIDLLAVGGITPDNMQPYLQAGCSGFGIGSALYNPEKSHFELELSAGHFVASIKKHAF